MPRQKEPQDAGLTLIEISRRLANIEALLAELLERKKANGRAAVRRKASVKQRARDRVIASGFKPTEQQAEAARRFVNERR